MGVWANFEGVDVQRWSGWLGAGVVTVGVGAAMLAGSGVAGADTGAPGGPDRGTSARSSGADAAADSNPSARDKKADKADKADKANKADEKKTEKREKAEKAERAGKDAGERAEKDADKKAAKAERAAKDADSSTAEQQRTADADVAKPEAEPEVVSVADVESAPEPGVKTEAEPEVVPAPDAKPAPDDKPAPESEVLPASGTEVETESELPREAAVHPGAVPAAAEVSGPAVEPAGVGEATTPATATPSASAQESPSAVPIRLAAADATTTLRVQQPVPITPQTGLHAVLTFVGNLIFGTVTLLEQVLVGPPVLPPNSTVTVQTSTLKVGNQKVQANWYFPDTDTPPDRLIWLQHGFLATGPMYSYTAAALAEQTGAVVVTPTFVSNILADTGFWLGGDELFRSVANLFVGDREDLTASAVAAGYATRYGLDPAEATLPQKFGIIGHSLGGSFTAGVSGYLAVNGAADDLVGAIMLDGVPWGPVMPTAMGQLGDYEDESGRSVPLRQIAAPWNLWNSLSNANEWLNRERPDTYNGVILTGGVHMDSMQGGNEVIQFLAYLFAGFPTEVNQAAVQQLAVAWFDEWFSGADVEDPELGTTITISTPYGDAYGGVIGTPAVESEKVDSLAA